VTCHEHEVHRQLANSVSCLPLVWYQHQQPHTNGTAGEESPALSHYLTRGRWRAVEHDKHEKQLAHHRQTSVSPPCGHFAVHASAPDSRSRHEPSCHATTAAQGQEVRSVRHMAHPSR